MKKELIKTAKELNEMLGLEPAIETNSKKITEEELTKKIKQAAGLIITDEDELSMPSQQVLSLLEVNPWDQGDSDKEMDEEEEKMEEPEKAKPEVKAKPEKAKPEKAKPEKAKPEVKAKPEKAKPKTTSAYGLTVELMCANPDLTKAELLVLLENAEIDTKIKSSAIQTGFGVVRKIVAELRKNKLMK